MYDKTSLVQHDLTCVQQDLTHVRQDLTHVQHDLTRVQQDSAERTRSCCFYSIPGPLMSVQQPGTIAGRYL